MVIISLHFVIFGDKPTILNEILIPEGKDKKIIESNCIDR
jgi:hypothetical protein